MSRRPKPAEGGRRAFYKRFPGDFMMGTRDLTLEERGAYNDLLDMLYDRGRPLPDEPKWIAGLLGVSVKKWRTIRQSLIDADKLVVRGETLSNPRWERESALDEAEHTAQVTWGSMGGKKRAQAERAARKAAEEEARRAAEPDLFGDENAPKMRPKSDFSADFGDDEFSENERRPLNSGENSQDPLKPARADHIPESRVKEDSPLLPRAEETSGKSKNGTRLALTWQPSALTPEVADLVANWPEGLLDSQLARFRDYWAGKTGRDGTKLDWDATWRNWIRKADSDKQRDDTRANGKRSGWRYATGR